MTARPTPEHGQSPAEGRAEGSRALNRLRQDVLLALGLKIVALALIGFLFFGPSHRLRGDPAELFSPVATRSPTNR
jgi:hypothetical protein